MTSEEKLTRLWQLACVLMAGGMVSAALYANKLQDQPSAIRECPVPVQKIVPAKPAPHPPAKVMI